MSYKIEVRADHRAYPVVICDHCGTRIEAAAEGNALWLEAGGPGATYDVRHTHRACTLAFKLSRPTGNAGRWSSNDLDYHFFLLLLNARYNARQGKRKAQCLASLP